MTTPTSDQLYVIAPIQHAPIVNDTLRNIGELPDGSDVLNANLCLPGQSAGPIVAKMSGWAMPAETNRQFKAAIRDAGWRPRPTAAELTVYNASTMDQVPAWGSGQRVWVFQAGHPWDSSIVVPDSVTFDEVLARLGLVVYERPRT